MTNVKAALTKISRVIVLSLSIVLMVAPPALAQNAPKIDFTDNNINYYDPRGNNVCGGTSSGGDTLTRFLQALADQESSGNPKAVSGGNATGKYQYIHGTWHSSAQAYYPPADKYDQAMDAPEEVQDAVAYIEYSVKFKQFNGDLFKLAVSHFYPAALDNPALLDIIPAPEAGNVLTPRQYAQAFIQRVNSGAGKDIPIKASQAPDFQTYLDKAGGQGGGGAAGGQVCSGTSVVAGDIIKTALNLAWPTPGHGKVQSDATPAYQAAMPKYNGATSDDPWSDCGVFVATVMRGSGADPTYQLRGTASQLAYVRSHPEKYEIVENPGNTADLQAGDVMIQDGHTYIFTGVYKGGDGKVYNSAAASLHDHVPQADNWYPGFVAARLKK